MTRRLTAAQVVRLHEKILAASGGAPGVTDQGAIESALARSFAGYAGHELFPSLEEKAAALARALALAHPLVDGNKRISLGIGAVLLMENGRRLLATEDDLERIGWALAAGRIDVPALAVWFRQNTRPST